MNNKIAEFIGWHLGDGCISTKGNRFQYSLTGDRVEERSFYENVIIPTFNEIFEDNLRKPINLRSYKSIGVCGIYLSDKKFVNFLQDKYNLIGGKKIEVKIPSFEKMNYVKSFLRGLFDTDGSIYFSRSHFKTKKESFFTIFHYKPKIKLATISENLILTVYQMLLDLGYYPRLRKPARQRINENIMYGVVLDLKADVNKWINEIGFKNEKHVSKIKLWQKYGFVPPYTKLKDRNLIIDDKLDPLSYYSGYEHYNIEEIKNKLLDNNH